MEPAEIARNKRRVIVAVGLLALIASGLIFLVASGRLWPLIDRLWEVFSGKEELRRYVESWGNMAPAAFMIVQALQVVLAPIPGEFTGAVGGFIFGALPTVLYSSVGLVAGSVIAFWAARIMGRPLVELIASRRTLDKLGFLTERRGFLAILILFVIPGFPKDILSYLLGLSPMGFLPFLVACTVGRLPGTIMLSYGGSALYDENWPLLVGLSVLCAVILVIGFLFRNGIDAWLRRTGGSKLERDAAASSKD
jgi:uncharacterized membrane protein YdjX (TVP38/TMEM64 family)